MHTSALFCSDWSYKSGFYRLYKDFYVCAISKVFVDRYKYLIKFKLNILLYLKYKVRRKETYIYIHIKGTHRLNLLRCWFTILIRCYIYYISYFLYAFTIKFVVKSCIKYNTESYYITLLLTFFFIILKE